MILEQGLPLGIHALEELASLCRCQLAHVYLLALPYLVPQATEHRQRSHHFSFPNQMTQDSILELHFEQLVKLVLQAHRLVFSCHHGLPLSLVVQHLWSHWKVMRLVGPY